MEQYENIDWLRRVLDKTKRIDPIGLAEAHNYITLQVGSREARSDLLKENLKFSVFLAVVYIY